MSLMNMAKKEGVKDTSDEKEKKKSTADLLLDNFVALQKVLTDVAVKLTNLNEQISNLLKLFEDAAKSFKEGKESEKKLGKGNVSEKLDKLIEQNKIIAQGLSAVEGAVASEKTKPKPLPEFRF
jgi:hypothetical protein